MGSVLDTERGPYDPPHSVPTSQGRFYADPAAEPGSDGSLLISVTNALDHHSKSALVPAAATFTTGYILDRLPAANRAAGDPKDMAEFAAEAREAYRREWERRADLGSRVHHQAEAINLGAPAVPDFEAAPFVESYLRWIDEYGVDIRPGHDVMAAECTVLNRTLRYGGTSDIWVRLRFDGPTSPIRPKNRPRSVPADPIPTPDGLWLVDIKTSLKHPSSAVWDDQPLQLAALRHAEVALLCPQECRYGETDSHDDSHEYKVPEFVGVAILNLRAKDYGFIPLPAGPAEFAAFKGLLPVANYMNTKDLRGFKPIQPPTRKDHR